MKITNLESGTPFSMGKGKNWSVLNPDGGAKTITLNHAIHDAGHEFTQHFHDESDDIILVLEGQVSLRQGNFLTPLEAGEAALVPAGEVHGTVNTSGATARLISFQIPPDLALYRGERNKAASDTPKPKTGTESTVEIARLAKGGPRFTEGVEVRTIFSPERGSSRVRLERAVIEEGDTFEYTARGTEVVLLLLSGVLELRVGDEKRLLERHDVVLLEKGESLTLEGTGGEPAVLIGCSSIVEKY